MFTDYDTRELGMQMVLVQEELDRCTPERPATIAYCRGLIMSMAQELLYRYRWETKRLNVKYCQQKT